MISTSQLNNHVVNKSLQSVKQYSRWVIVYPSYINSKKTICEGRRISKEKVSMNCKHLLINYDGNFTSVSKVSELWKSKWLLLSMFSPIGGCWCCPHMWGIGFFHTIFEQMPQCQAINICQMKCYQIALDCDKNTFMWL